MAVRESNRSSHLKVFLGKVFWKYAANLQEKCEFNKLHFGMSVFLCIKFAACTFSEHVFLRTPLDGCF